MCICLAWCKHERGWENSRQLCKPETKSRICITVSNSPNPLSVHIRLCKHRKKVFYCFCKITFPRKNAKLFVMALIKKEILTSRKLLYKKSCTRNQFLFCKKMLFKIQIFFRGKKIDTPSLWRFFKFQPTEEWVNKVNLSNFELENLFKFALAWLAREKQTSWRHNHVYILSRKHSSRPIRARIQS